MHSPSRRPKNRRTRCRRSSRATRGPGPAAKPVDQPDAVDPAAAERADPVVDAAGRRVRCRVVEPAGRAGRRGRSRGRARSHRRRCGSGQEAGQSSPVGGGRRSTGAGTGPVDARRQPSAPPGQPPQAAPAPSTGRSAAVAGRAALLPAGRPRSASAAAADGPVSYRADELMQALPLPREAPAEKGVRSVLRLRPGTLRALRADRPRDRGDGLPPSGDDHRREPEGRLGQDADHAAAGRCARSGPRRRCRGLGQQRAARQHAPAHPRHQHAARPSRTCCRRCRC